MFPFFLLVRLYWHMFEYHPVFQDCLTQEMDNTCALLFAVCIIQTAVMVSISWSFNKLNMVTLEFDIT